MQLEIPFDEVSAERLMELRGQVVGLTHELLERARRQWPRVDFTGVETRFRLRGHAAGEACTTISIANYNLDLLKRYGEDFVRRIVPHEVAHIVAGRVWDGRVRPHGAEWGAVMRFFGADTSVTHDYETKPARRTRRFRYRCRCADPHQLTTRAHRRITRGWAEYTCRVCRERLVHVG